MTEQQQEHGGRISLIIGFILNSFDWVVGNIETMDFYFGVLLKFTSLISFFLFLFLNWNKILKRWGEILK